MGSCLKTYKDISNITDDELLIIGELLGIDVYLNSFRVRYQYVSTDDIRMMLPVHEIYYPIRYLKRFFQVNGEIEQRHYTPRIEEYFTKDA